MQRLHKMYQQKQVVSYKEYHNMCQQQMEPHKQVVVSFKEYHQWILYVLEQRPQVNARERGGIVDGVQQVPQAA